MYWSRGTSWTSVVSLMCPDGRLSIRSYFSFWRSSLSRVLLPAFLPTTRRVQHHDLNRNFRIKIESIFPHAMKKEKNQYSLCVWRKNKVYGINLLWKRSLWSRFTHHQIDRYYGGLLMTVFRIEKMRSPPMPVSTRQVRGLVSAMSRFSFTSPQSLHQRGTWCSCSSIQNVQQQCEQQESQKCWNGY